MTLIVPILTVYSYITMPVRTKWAYSIDFQKPSIYISRPSIHLEFQFHIVTLRKHQRFDFIIIDDNICLFNIATFAIYPGTYTHTSCWVLYIICLPWSDTSSMVKRNPVYCICFTGTFEYEAPLVIVWNDTHSGNSDWVMNLSIGKPRSVKHFTNAEAIRIT